MPRFNLIYELCLSISLLIRMPDLQRISNFDFKCNLKNVFPAGPNFTTTHLVEVRIARWAVGLADCADREDLILAIARPRVLGIDEEPDTLQPLLERAVSDELFDITLVRADMSAPKPARLVEQPRVLVELWSTLAPVANIKALFQIWHIARAARTHYGYYNELINIDSQK